MLDFSLVPASLKERKQWLVWRSEQKSGAKKPGKMPYYASGKRRAGVQGSDADRSTLEYFEEAVSSIDRLSATGIGFSFLPGDGLIGIDLDNAVDAETGEISPRAQAIITACHSYTEWSPSGKGFHIFVQGETTTAKDNGIGVEMFCGSQFFTVTGRHLAGTPLEVMPLDPKVMARLHKTIALAKGGYSDKPAIAKPAISEREKISSALAAIDAGIGYDDWLRVGMALHAELGEAGFPVWNYWSSRSDKYPGEKELRSHWKSFKAGAVKIGTLFHLAGQCGWKPAKLRAEGIPEAAAVVAESSPGMGGDDESWPDLAIPGAAVSPTIPPSVLGGWLGDMAAAVAESTQTPPAAAVMICLAVVATVLQRRYTVGPKGADDDYVEPLPLWVLVAMQSGSRKTAVLNLLIAPLLEWEETERQVLRSSVAKVASERAVILARIKKLTDKAAGADDAAERRKFLQEIEMLKSELPDEVHSPRLFGSDTTPESAQVTLAQQGERYAILGDEPGIFNIMAGVYSGGRANNDVFLQSHAGSPLRVVRAEREAYLSNPAMSFGVMIQPGILEEVAGNRQFRHSGLLARFLFALPENNIGKRDVRRTTAIPRPVSEAYRAGVLRLLEGRKSFADTPKRINFSTSATELWFDFAEDIERQQGDGGRFEAIRDWTGKLPGAVARIAAVLEIVEVGHAVDDVGVSAVERAISLARLLTEHAVIMFGMIGASDEDVDAKAILRWIKAGGQLTFDRTALYNGMEARFGGRVERLDEALKRLQKWGAIRLHQIRAAKKAGRPATVIAVNPRVFSN